MLRLLRGAVGLDARRERLAGYAGWTSEDLRAFNAALRSQRIVDPPGLGMTAIETLVLDTSAYGHLRAGHADTVDHLAAAKTVVLPVTVLGEIEAGFELGPRPRENRRVLAQLLAEPWVDVVWTLRRRPRGTTRACSPPYAAPRTPIPTNNIWVAAATLECSGRLLTFDRYYSCVAELDHTLLDAP